MTALDDRPIHPWVAAGADRVRFGIAFGPRNDWSTLRDFVQAVEELGFDSYWTSDHPLLTRECWTTLAAAALVTRRLRLGSLVNCVGYRHPVLLARQVADVDHLSQGRAVLGVGIGDMDFEFARMGLPYAPTKDRQAALEEAVQIIQALLRGREPVTFRGRHFSVSESVLSPPATQQPHIPLLIGGGGGRVTLRQVAQYADMANWSESYLAGSARTLADVARKYAALRGHCEALGRPVEAVLRSHATFYLVLAPDAAAARAKVEQFPPLLRELSRDATLAGTPADAIAHYRALRDLGLQYLIACICGNDLETVRLLAEEVVPQVNAL
jgi:alkanesulfonate monooxygenase SsuD/methylene tetrahydromethanopterin reductase-like flavin-dependent oxidoreductase (luciferase family)